MALITLSAEAANLVAIISSNLIRQIINEVTTMTPDEIDERTKQEELRAEGLKNKLNTQGEE
jgi:hypothetical protein